MISLDRNLAAPDKCTVHLIVPVAEREFSSNVVKCLERELGTRTPSVGLHTLQFPNFNIGKSGDERLDGLASVFAKFYLPEYLPGLERAVWLDTDTIVRLTSGASTECAWAMHPWPPWLRARSWTTT